MRIFFDPREDEAAILAEIATQIIEDAGSRAAERLIGAPPVGRIMLVVGLWSLLLVGENRRREARPLALHYRSR